MVKAYSALAAENPFAQPTTYFSLVIHMATESNEILEAHFSDEVFSIATFEQPDLSWRAEMVLADVPNEELIAQRIETIKQSGIEVHDWSIEEQEMRDWESEIQEQFPPLEVGQFYIHGSHIDAKPRPAISLEINAGRAFGTGEHATTEGCLRALLWLKKQHRFANILDLGCGTGILALAAQRLWRDATVIGSDMDAVSVEVANENARDNLAPQIEFVTAKGFQSPRIVRRKPYDLLVANILARPLIQLGEEIVQAVQPGGYIVLSGLLERQEKDVLLAYRGRGMVLEKAFHLDGWSALVLRKPAIGR